MYQLQALFSGFRIKAQKKQKTMRKKNIQCDSAPYRFMYKRDNDKIDESAAILLEPTTTCSAKGGSQNPS